MEKEKRKKEKVAQTNLRRIYSYIIYIIYIQASKSVFFYICICSGVKGASTNSYEDIHGDEEKQRRGGGHVKHGEYLEPSHQ